MRKNETGEELDKDEIIALLLSVLENYPKHDIQHLQLLLAHPKTKKIATGLLEGKVHNLSTDDFEGVARVGTFLHICGVYLAMCGTNYDRIDFLNLAIDLFEGSRRYLKRGTHDYSSNLMNEGATRATLAQLGVNPAENLEKALTLYDRARREGFEKNTPSYVTTLMNEGNARVTLAQLGVNPAENLKKALTLYDRARVEGFEKNTPDYATVLMNEGIVRQKLAELGINPVENLEKALTLYDRARRKGFEKNTPDYASALANEGTARQKLAGLGVNPAENLEKALTLYERARSEGLVTNTPDYARALANEGNARQRLAELGVNPAENLETSLTLSERARSEGFVTNTPDYASAFMNEGNARGSLAGLGVNPAENLEKALTLYECARSEGLEKNTPDYATVLMNEGIVRQKLAELGINPVENLEKALTLYECARSEGLEKNTPDYATVLMNEGNARQTLAELGVNPAKNLEKALTLYEPARSEGLVKNTPDYARAFMNEGIARQKLAGLGINPVENLEKALTLYERARSEGFVKNTPGYARAFMNEGTARLRLAGLGINPAENLEKALTLYERARSEGLVRNTPDYAQAFMNEGSARLRLAELGVNPAENLENALTLYERARSGGFVKNTPNYASAFMNEGNARQRLAGLGVNPAENQENALTLYERARSEGFVKNTPDYASALANEGTARQKLAELGVNPVENLESALTLYDRARVESFEKNTPDYASALMNEGNARQKLAELGVNPADNLNKAESMYLESKDIFSQVNDTISLIKVNENAGYLKYSTNEMQEAYDYLGEAIELIEEMRASMKIPELRKEYFETVVDTHKNMVFTCLALGKDEEAFRYAESAKGRTFLELLASEKKRLKGDPELIEKYKDVLGEIDEIEAKLMSGKERGKELEERLQDLKRSHDDLLRKIKQSDPEYYSIKTVEPISPDELSGILNGRTLVEYFVGDKLAIFVVNGDLTVKEKEINEKELSEKVFEFRELISKLEGHLKNGTNPDEAEESEKAEKILTEFYKLLIEPIKDHLSKEIVIVPHSYLHLIPFQALKGERYLIEDHKVCFAQSASSLEFLNEGAGKGALIVGNPTKDLRFAEIEAKEVAEIFNTSPIIGDGAKKDRVMEEMKNKEILHFSCHGLFDPYNPAFSRVILSDGSITARDFMNLEMDANLTVLSACETALAKVARGDEVEGLVRAIQYGGCRFVIASLWKVEDRSTKELFLKFYNTKGGDIVDRIREAELSLMKEYGFYFWAPFQVYGIESG